MRFRIFLYFTLLIVPVKLLAQSNVEFIENRGQWDGPFKYKASTPKGDIYLESNCFTYVLGDPANGDKVDAAHHGWTRNAETLNFHAYKMFFEGANMPLIVGSKQQTTYYNYFLGKDPSRWQSNIHPFYDIDYKNLYNGIDMHVSSEGGNVVYEFIVQPDADASQISMDYKGQNSIRLRDKDLYIATSVGDVVEMKPYAYQYINDTKVEVPCKYKLNGNTVTFQMPEGYDHSQLLVIDPTIVFCTFTGSTADNWGFTATYDNQGNFYAGGIVHGTGYPVSTGAYQITYHGGVDVSFGSTNTTHGSGYADDIGIIKFDPTGVNRLYATYLGGSDNEQPHSLIVDGSGNLIMGGRSYSNDYPVTSGAFDVTANGDADIVISKLNSTGTSLLASTYVGGSNPDVVNYNPLELFFGNLKHNYGDDARSEVQVDRQGNVYMVASTMSTNFPTANATQTTLSGNQDAVIIKLNSTLTTMLWSTYLGGSSDDAAYVIVFDTSQAYVYIGGGTQSSNFPGTASSSYHQTFQGGSADGWIAKFQNSGTYPLVKTTYIGTSAYDQVFGLQVDNQNSLYAMGQTLGAFPVSTGVYSNSGSSQFIIKMDSNLSTNILSTVYGSGTTTATNISPVAFLVDTCQNIYISGWGGNLGLNLVGGNPPASAGTTNMPITTNAAQSTTDGNDFYFICLSKNMQSLMYATYFGRNETDPLKGEHVDGGTSRFDKNGIVYQGICGGCAGNGQAAQSTFPTQPHNVWSLSDNSNNCNEVALKIAFQFGPVNASATPNPTSGKGCAPFFVQFQNLSSNAASYQWIFGDGSAIDTTFAPSHTFTTAGHYTVKLVVKNANACTKTIDTAYVSIVVDTGSAVTPQFTFTKTDSCGPYEATFINTSLHGSAATQYIWSFGDNTTYTGVTPPVHTFAAAGSYTVTLTTIDTTACDSSSSVSHTVTFSGLKVKAGFTANDTTCVNTPATFTNTTSNGSNFTYYVSNGGGTITGNATSTSYTFTDTGWYSVTLIATNSAACNGEDTLTRRIYVINGPVANFSFSPTVPVTNVPISFTNLSTGAVRYAWDFGDNTGSTDVNPTHMYKRTGEYTACLTAYNSQSCPAKLCKTTSADIQPIADLPTAFSPNGDGANDVLYVRGAAIQSIDLLIFNRWGQLVFESKNQEIGWDGTYNGKPQEMDAYAYVLKVLFIDGTTLQKKGNVTLLR